ncbi:MAG: hypothetical protein ABI791_07910 [Acidobacteriota bacterium]
MDFPIIESKLRLSGWAAIASVVAGMVTIASLMTNLTTQADIDLETGVMPTEVAIPGFVLIPIWAIVLGRKLLAPL